MTTRLVYFVLLAISLCGCCTQQEKSGPPAKARVISLDKAVEEIQQTLANAKSRDGKSKAGLLPSKATVTFVMAAEEGTDAKHGGEIGVALPVGLTLGATNEVTNSVKDSASNTIVLEFENALLAPQDSVFGQIADRAKWTKVKDVTEATKDENALTPAASSPP
jgi:hypothetical protein